MTSHVTRNFSGRQWRKPIIIMWYQIESARVPSYSKMEILVEVKGCTWNKSCCVLESKLHNSDIE